jgi:hypothetical protein
MLQELEQIVAHLKESRVSLLRALDQLAQAQAQAAQVMVNPAWSVKDMVGHLVASERGMTRMAQRFATGTNPKLPADYNNDVYNARQVAKFTAVSYEQARADLDATRNELLTLMETFTLPQLDYRGEHPIKGDISLKELLSVIAWHEEMHSQEISDKLLELKK